MSLTDRFGASRGVLAVCALVLLTTAPTRSPARMWPSI